MAFTVEEWQEKIREEFQAIQGKAKEGWASSLYGLLAASSLLPVMQVIKTDPMAGLVALGSVAGGVGGSLLANKVQEWKNQSDVEKFAEKIDQDVLADPGLREAIDALHTRLNTLEIAKEYPNITERSAHLQGSGTIVSGDGSQGAGAGGNAVGSADNCVIQTIDKSRTSETQINNLYQQMVPAENAASPVSWEGEYLKKLRNKCLALPLAAMGSDDGAMNRVRLDQVYVEMDTTTRVKLTEEESAAQEKETEHRSQKREDRALPLLEAACAAKLLVVLGDPGGGKSTFVKQLAALLAQGRGGSCKPEGWGDPELPVILNLRDLVPGLNELDLREKSLEAEKRLLYQAVLDQYASAFEDLELPQFMPELQKTLTDGAALLIFDGLDEVPEHMRNLVRKAVMAVASMNGRKHRVVVTCRSRSFNESTQLKGFAVYTLAPLDRGKIKGFVAAWYQAQTDELGQKKVHDKTVDLQQAAQRGDLAELASNPMLLTTMAIIHQKNVGLPEQRVKLYKQAVILLLRTWQTHKSGRLPVSPELAEVIANDRKFYEIVENLAYCVHSCQASGTCDSSSGEKQATVVERSQLFKELEREENFGDFRLAGEFLEYIDHHAGLMVGHGGGGHTAHTYSFPHRTFQEYLVGRRMIRGRSFKREFQNKRAEGDFWSVAAQLGAEELEYNSGRSELLLDLAMALSPTTEINSAEDSWGVLWSGRMALVLGEDKIREDTGGDGEAYRQRVCHQLLAVMRHSSLGVQERVEAGRVLAQLGDPREAVIFPERTEFKEIRAGRFNMGSSKGAQGVDDEYPSFDYVLPLYKIARYPVTQSQFRDFVEDGGYQNAGYWPEAQREKVWKDGWVKDLFGPDPRNESKHLGGVFSLPNHPVVGISWYEAVAYCRWLTQRMEEKSIIEPGWEIRLPFETEWEKAARGDKGQDYPWEGVFDRTKCNAKETQIGTTSAVGCFPAGSSPDGVEEMMGNVWEWTASTYGQYPYPDIGKPLQKRQNLSAAKDVSRVVRGGSFGNHAKDVRCAARFWDGPDFGNYDLGFRVVCAPIFTSGI